MEKLSKIQEASTERAPHRPYARTLLLLFLIPVVITLSFILIKNHGVSDARASARAASLYQFGTLETDPTRAAQEYAAGVRVAQQTVGWKDYETGDGVFDEGYFNDVKNRIKTDLAAGLKVVISPALHYPPNWVMNLPGARYVNQFGVNAPLTWAGGFAEPNFVFSQPVRDRIVQFETHMMQQLASDPAIGLKNIWAVRYVTGSIGETMYPPANDQQGHDNSYWAFDEEAQGQGTNRPATIPASPFPGWKPGDTTYHGQAFATAQVKQWYDWYVNAHSDFVNWHTNLFRDPHGINYQGYLQLLTPGFGVRAYEYNNSLAHYLDGSQDPNRTVARASIWQKLYPAIVNKANIVAYVSSMADGSGAPHDDGCHGGESLVNYDTDPQVNTWSAARYVTGLADKYGLLKNGENPGSGDPNRGVSYGLAMMQTSAAQMQSCHFQGMFWAHDNTLYDGVSGVTLQDYANVIAHYNTVALIPIPTVTRPTSLTATPGLSTPSTVPTTNGAAFPAGPRSAPPAFPWAGAIALCITTGVAGGAALLWRRRRQQQSAQMQTFALAEEPEGFVDEWEMQGSWPARDDWRD